MLSIRRNANEKQMKNSNEIKTVKTTAKKFILNREVMYAASRSIRKLMDQEEGCDTDELNLFKSIVEQKESYFETVESVNLKFWIGSRSYCEQGYKIGKSYFGKQKEKLTRSNGFHSIVEIPAITDEMKQEMIDDLHWY